MSNPPPTGLASFLFTDVAGSTRLWEEDADAMAASLRNHDQILRSVIETNQGYVFSTAGDAFAAAFPTAEAAVTAALAAQLDLRAAEWPGPAIQVRMGIHTGSAEERGGDYFGPVLNRAARIMSAGNGGQLLISSVTADLLADRLPQPSRLFDLGLHRLKDLDRPEHLYELRHPGLSEITSPIRTADVKHSNLPEHLTSFVGRAQEIEEIGDILAQTRLVTLTGVGGTGKTRLGQEVAKQLAATYEDGVWLAELAPVTDASLVANEIAGVWGLRAGEGADIESVLHGHVGEKHLLLIVDNCEHVIDVAASVIDRLLRGAPDVKIIATSRESLGVQGEVVYHVPSLGVTDDVDGAGHSEAVKLFLDRAHAVRPDFEPGEHDLRAIVDICRRIDGIPLGVELAAARLRAMDPVQLAERLNDSFRILGSKTALPRHRTLETTIEWSHGLLKPEGQAVFRRLSVFAGGFDLLGAEAVCPGDDLEEWEIVDWVDDLVDKSLVIADHQPGGVTRFRILEPIRQYGAERLEEAGEQDGISLAHAHYFSDLCRRAEPHLRGPGQLEWSDRIELEYDNIRVALTTLLENGRLDQYLDACSDITYYWGRTGSHIEGIDLLVAGLESGHEADPIKMVQGWYRAASLALDITMPVSVEYGEKAVALAEQLDEPHSLGRAELMLGIALKNTTTRYEEGDDHFMAGDALIREHSDPRWGAGDWNEAELALFRGAYYPYLHPDRQALFQQAIDGFRAMGDEAASARAEIVSAFLFGLVDDDWVFANLTNAVRTARKTGFRQELGHALFFWNGRARPRGLIEEAREAALEAEQILAEIGDRPCEAGSALGAAAAATELGLLEEATVDLVRAARKQLALERRNNLPRVLDFAVGLTIARGNHALAATLLGRAESHALEGPRVEQLAGHRATLEAELGDGLAPLVERGGQVSDDEAVAMFLEWAKSPTST